MQNFLAEEESTEREYTEQKVYRQILYIALVCDQHFTSPWLKKKLTIEITPPNIESLKKEPNINSNAAVIPAHIHTPFM